MGDPTNFFIKVGANPHTRDWLGLRKEVDSGKAMRQWRFMAETLLEYDVNIFVVPPHPELPGLVFPANAGMVLEPENALPLSKRDYVLANLSQGRSVEQEVYSLFLDGLGVKIHALDAQFEGEADLIPWGDRFIFTYGEIREHRLVPQWDFPPWKWVYGFRSDPAVLRELAPRIPLEKVLSIELSREAFYHGDTVFSSFGPKREFLLAYQGGIKSEGREILENHPDVIWLSDVDGRHFVANSFQVIHKGQCILFMPQGVSLDLQHKMEDRGVKTVLLDVSEFFEKGGGSVKCMMGDLGAWAEDEDAAPEVMGFRERCKYSNIYKPF